jgi:hypothetical protein
MTSLGARNVRSPVFLVEGVVQDLGTGGTGDMCLDVLVWLAKSNIGHIVRLSGLMLAFN